jgi:hypothetical protein
VIHEDDIKHGFGKPPFFDGINYPYWKIHMSAHLQAQTDGSRRFVRILTMRCLLLVLVKSRLTSTMLIVFSF